MMMTQLHHEIILYPQPEDVGTITVHVKVDGYDSTFQITTSLENFNEDECRRSKEHLNDFLMESGINDDDTANGILNLINYVDDVTSPASTGDYIPGCALQVWLSLVYDDEDNLVDEAAQVSFEENQNIEFKPARNSVVEALPRSLYDNTASTAKTCRICLGDYNNGASVVTLPCGHYFDEECVVGWFRTSHVCPLCRFELPCEDQ